MAKLQPEDCLQTKSPIHTDELAAMLRREGFIVRPAKGDHFHYFHPDVPWVRGGLVFHAKTSVYQHEAARACLQVRDEMMDVPEENLQQEWAGATKSFSIQELLPETLERVGETDTEFHVRCKKPQVIGMGIPLNASPEKVKALLARLERTGAEFNQLLGRSKSQYDYEYKVNDEGAVLMAHQTYSSLQKGIPPYTMDTLDENPMDEVSDMILEVQIRDHVFDDYMDYFQSLPFIHGVGTAQKERKGDVRRLISFHDPVKLRSINSQGFGTQNERSPLGIIAAIFEKIGSVTAASFNAKNLRQYRAFDVKRDGERLHGTFVLDSDIQFDIPMISVRMSREIQAYDELDDRPIEDIEKILREARGQVAPVVEAYNGFMAVHAAAKDLTLRGTERLDQLIDRMKPAGFKVVGVSKLTPGKEAFYRFSGPVQMQVKGHVVLRESGDKGWVFSQQALAEAEDAFDSYLKANTPQIIAPSKTESFPFSSSVAGNPLSSAIKQTFSGPGTSQDLPDFLKKDR